MSNEPTGTRLERISPTPLTYEVWTRSSSHLAGHPVEVGIPNIQEAFRRLAAYGGPEYFEIRDSNGNLVYEAPRDEAPHYHYHQQRVHAAPTPSAEPRKMEGAKLWVISALVILGLFLAIALSAGSGSDEPATGEASAGTAGDADDVTDAELAQLTAENLEEAAMRDQMQEENKANASRFFQGDDGSEGVYVISDAIDGELCSGDRIWVFGQPTGTAPMEDGVPMNGRFIYLDMSGGKATRGLYKWDGSGLMTKTVVAGDFDPATTDVNDPAFWDTSSSFYREVMESWQSLPLRHVNTVTERHVYNRFVIGRKTYMLCRLS